MSHNELNSTIDQAFKYYAGLSPEDKARCRYVNVAIPNHDVMYHQPAESSITFKTPTVERFTVEQLRDYAVESLINAQKKTEEDKATIASLTDALSYSLATANRSVLFLRALLDEWVLPCGGRAIGAENCIKNASTVLLSAFEVLKKVKHYT